MNCTSCGAPLAEGQKFCTNCGNAVAAQQQPSQQAAQQPAPQQHNPYQQPTSEYQQATQGVAGHNPQSAAQHNPYGQPYQQPQQQASDGGFDPQQIPGYIPGYDPEQNMGGQPYSQPYGGQPFNQPVQPYGQPTPPKKKKSKVLIIVLVLVALLVVGPVACGACALLVYDGDDHVLNSNTNNSTSPKTPSTPHEKGNGKGVDQMVGTWNISSGSGDIAFKLGQNGTVEVSEDNGPWTDVSDDARWESYGIEDGKCVMSVVVEDEKDSGVEMEFQICFPDGAKKGNLEGDYEIIFKNIGNGEHNSSDLGLGDIVMGAKCKKGGEADVKVSMGKLNSSVSGEWKELPVNNGWGVTIDAAGTKPMTITHYK